MRVREQRDAGWKSRVARSRRTNRKREGGRERESKGREKGVVMTARGQARAPAEMKKAQHFKKRKNERKKEKEK